MVQHFNPPRFKMVLQGAGLTILTLFGGMVVGMLSGNAVFGMLPGHSVANPSSFHVILAAIPGVTGFVAGSAA